MSSEQDESHTSILDEVEQLLNRCKTLQAELERFNNYVLAQKAAKQVDIRPFYSSVCSELKSLQRSKQRISSTDWDKTQASHSLRSSNLPFYEAVWSTAKTTKSLVTFSKRFYLDSKQIRAKTAHGKGREAQLERTRRSALVDVVTEGGAEWIKVSTITETRLLFEKAKAGWETWDAFDDSDEDDIGDGDDDNDQLNDNANHDQEDYELVNGVEDNGHGTTEKQHQQADEIEVIEAGQGSGDGRIELVKIAADLHKASRVTRVNYRHPRVRFVLPKVNRGSSEIVDEIIRDIEGTGSQVDCGTDVPLLVNSFTALSPNKDHNEEFAHLRSLIPPQLPALTDTLNLDCTILLALVSDLSHYDTATLTLPDTPHPSLLHQIEVERSDPLLRSTLYPGLRDHRLVTSRESAARMREIVDQIGTSEEVRRTRVLLGDDGGGDSTVAFGRGSAYPPPHDLQLPVVVVEDEDEVASIAINKMNLQPAVDPSDKLMKSVADGLTPINQSVFLLGWRHGWTTVTSNRVVAKIIETTITAEMDALEAKGVSEDDLGDGPKMWIVSVARSLIGKEKGRDSTESKLKQIWR